MRTPEHMLVSIATEPAAPALPNEDFAAVTADTAVLLDGAGIPEGSQSGCVHGVAWYARTLGCRLLAGAAPEAAKPLPRALADAITEVRTEHEHTCDLEHVGSPSATVIVARINRSSLEYLVLADSVLLLDRSREAGPQAVTDDRLERAATPHRKHINGLAIGTAEHATARRRYVETIWKSYRNREGGFWVASSDPAAAEHALTGSVALPEVRSFVLLSDGASRLVDRFGLMTWPQVRDILRDHGPDELLRRTREAEESDPRGRRWPRTKVRDDATVVYCRFGESS